MPPIKPASCRARIAISAGAALLSLALAACQSKLPEQDSPVARLYVERCGNCHAAYNPRSLTPAMWAAQMKLMEDKIRKSGLPALTAGESKTILDYLTRNSATN